MMKDKLIEMEGIKELFYPPLSMVGTKNYNAFIKWIVNYLKNLNSKKNNSINKNINVFGTGTSGAMILALLKTKLIKYDNINFIQLRKLAEKCHRDNLSTYIDTNDYNILIDDFIATGETLKTMENTIAQENKKVDLKIHSVFTTTSKSTLLFFKNLNFNSKLDKRINSFNDTLFSVTGY